MSIHIPFRWGLIMAFVALLMVVSAVAAQDTDPVILTPETDGIAEPVPPDVEFQPQLPPKQAFVPGEIGEAIINESGSIASVTANLKESESNNTFATANRMNIGDVMSGKIAPKGDVDTYRIDVPASTTVIIEIDAQVNGSSLDSFICLYDKQKTEQTCNYGSDGADSLIYWLLNGPDTTPGTPYYIRVRQYDNDAGGANYHYKLSVYHPLLVSATSDGVVAGIPFQKADILAHYDFPGGAEKWMLFFDASDVGITQNVNSVAGAYYDGEIHITLAAADKWYFYPFDVVKTSVTPYDVIKVRPIALKGYGSFGPRTAVGFSFNYRGKDYGLTTSGEKLDALAFPFTVSTTGKATFNSGLTAADEDISNLPYGQLYFDGSRVPGLSGYNVTAADVRWATNHDNYYLTILGSGTVDGKSFTQKDIFEVNGATYRVIGKYWRGGDHHFPYKIDAFDAVD